MDTRIPLAPLFDRAAFLADGRHEAAVSVRRTVDVFLYGHIPAPVWSLYGLFGYEGMMMVLAQNPWLALHACGRIGHNTAQRIRMIAALGADAVWIEECLADQICPGAYLDVNVPMVQECVREIRESGMKSICYFCGNPADRLDSILAAGADALHFEEGKKGFHLDIADLAEQIAGRAVLFGKLDAINLLEHRPEEDLRSEIRRQLDAGRKNGNRFGYEHRQSHHSTHRRGKGPALYECGAGMRGSVQLNNSREPHPRV